MQHKIPVLITIAAIGILAIGLRFTNTTTSSDELPVRELEGLDSSVQSAAADLEDLGPGAKMLVAAFAAQPPASAAGNSQPELIPEEWEQPLFDILLNEEITMDQRNAGLIDLATGPAIGVPSVQEECLMHLVFGISDDNGAQFVAVATNPAIPVGMRAEFLKQALEMRPQELGEWLSQQVSNHYEPEISAIARLYLLDHKAEPQ